MRARVYTCILLYYIRYTGCVDDLRMEGKMIRLQRTMKVKRGKHAMTWAKEIFDYLTTTHSKPAIHLFTSRFGNVSTLYWTIDFKDLATLETWQHKLRTDAGYLKLAKNSLDLIIEGTVEDTVLKSV
ncbi:MAG: hypothetical protein H6Q52_1530 [Deltaproteobacteria bacterium]|nr:hypothetical protein [Deltaproteobacteria bacterium]